MNPNFLHVRSNRSQAELVLSKWLGREMDMKNVDVEEEENGWVTISIDLDYGETDEWLKLAADVDFLYESYSTSLCMGELVFCSSGKIIRHVLFDDENPSISVDIGQLRSELNSPLKSWVDIWGYVDNWTWTKEIQD